MISGADNRCALGVGHVCVCCIYENRGGETYLYGGVGFIKNL